MSTSSPRQRRTTRTVTMFSAIVVVACVGWAWLVQEVRPDACQVPPTPPNAQYLHC